MTIYIHKAQLKLGKLLVIKLIEGLIVEQLNDWEDVPKGKQYSLYKEGDLEELFIKVEQ